ncbi:MAG: dihydrodipicolinate synthase family protein [Ardenticatenaceae bacterium]|nr:dihydrodipicolinate synthase family protein [Ardenticatenaceae bacterium]MCB9445275.1 dihydrodipicolinate synthase family protein [Ardenticatenaceae bacterium]
MATPLQSDGYHINEAVVPLLIDFLIGKGIKGLFVGGTTGEGLALDLEERIRLHEFTVTAVNHRIPVLIHVGANDMKTAVALTQHAAQLHPDALVAIPPTFFGIDDAALTGYFQTIAAAAPEIPLLLYDIPQLAVNGISPALLAQLKQELPTLAGVKTSRPDAQVIRQLIDVAAGDLLVLAGNERIALGSLAMGADGLISGLSTAVPEPFVALTQAVGDGDLAAARHAHQTINRILDLLPARRIGGIKQILAERGIPVGTAVPPRLMPSEPIWPHMKPFIS